MSQSFTISEQGIQKEYARLRQRMFFLIALMVPVGLIIPVLNGTLSLDEGNILKTIVVGAVLAFVLTIGMVKALQIQRRRLATYELYLSGETVTRTQQQLPDLTLHRDEIQRITESPTTGLVIRGKRDVQIIVVPSTIDSYDAVRFILNSWCPIETAPWYKSSMVYKSVARSVVSIVLIIVFFASTSPAIVVSSGVLITAQTIWNWIELRKNPNMDAQLKRSTWYFVVLIILVISRIIIIVTHS